MTWAALLRFNVWLISLLLLAAALIPVSLLMAGWVFGRADHIERAKDIAAVISPALTGGTVLISALLSR